MTLSIAGTPWGREQLTPELRAAIEAIVPPEIGRLTIAGRGDCAARVYRRRGEPVAGAAYHARTVLEAVGAAVFDYRCGAFLAWCSACPQPAAYQIDGEAYCLDCEPTRGGTVR